MSDGSTRSGDANEEKGKKKPKTDRTPNPGWVVSSERFCCQPISYGQTVQTRDVIPTQIRPSIILSRSDTGDKGTIGRFVAVAVVDERDDGTHKKKEAKSRTISTEPRERLERLLTIDHRVGNPRRSQIQRLASRTRLRGPGVAILLGFRRRRRRSIHDGARRARRTGSGVLFAFRRAMLRRSRHRARRGTSVRHHRHRHWTVGKRCRFNASREILSPLASFRRLTRPRARVGWFTRRRESVERVRRSRASFRRVRSRRSRRAAPCEDALDSFASETRSPARSESVGPWYHTRVSFYHTVAVFTTIHPYVDDHSLFSHPISFSSEFRRPPLGIHGS